MFSDLSRLVLPRSIALVGASDRAGSLGARTFDNLANHSTWAGDLHLVNPSGRALFGRSSQRSVADLQDTPDVAILAVPASQTLASLQACAGRGIPFAVVFTSGFGETGEAGRQVERRMQDIVAASGMRIYGPNSPGLNNINGGLGMSFSPAFQSDRLPGPIGVTTQGGGLGRAFMQSAMARGVGTGLWCSSGNEVDLEVSDFIHYMAGAADIRVIFTVLEGVRHGPRFMAAALHAARQGKPVIALKVGKSEIGARAAQSHTAAIAGSAEINAAAMRDLGVVEVDDIDEAVDLATLFARRPASGREKLAVYTFSGGAAAHTVDRLGVAGLTLATLAADTRAQLAAALPPYAAFDNPVDVTAEILVDNELCQRTLGITADDPEVDLVLVPMPVEYGQTSARMAEAMVAVQRTNPTPIVPIWISDRSGEGQVRMIEGGLAPLRSVRNTALALRRYVDHGRWVAAADPSWLPLRVPGSGAGAAAMTPSAGSNVIDPAVVSGRRYTEQQAKALLAEAGIPVPAAHRVRSAAEAAAAFARLGAEAVILKVSSEDITHKTDVGGVIAGIRSAADAASGFERIMRSVRAALPQAALDGVLVETLLTDPFIEVVIGVHADPVYGPVCTFGQGGVAIELYRDVSRCLLPLTPAAARALIERTHCARLLAGYRQAGRHDVDALVDVMVAISRFVARHGDVIGELEINPLAVRREGLGVVALDAVLSTVAATNGAYRES